MKLKSSKLTASVLKEFQVAFEHQKSKQADIIRRMREAVNVGKIKKIKKNLGMTK
jgi:hypothetical protein